MAKFQIDAMLDAALDYISTNAIEIYVCNAQPTTYAEASSTFALTNIEVPTFQANANGDVSGSKLAVDEEAGMDINSTDTATHVALSSAGTVTIPTWDIEIEDAA